MMLHRFAKAATALASLAPSAAAAANAVGTTAYSSHVTSAQSLEREVIRRALAETGGDVVTASDIATWFAQHVARNVAAVEHVLREELHAFSPPSATRHHLAAAAVAAGDGIADEDTINLAAVGPSSATSTVAVRRPQRPLGALAIRNALGRLQAATGQARPPESTTSSAASSSPAPAPTRRVGVAGLRGRVLDTITALAATKGAVSTNSAEAQAPRMTTTTDVVPFGPPKSDTTAPPSLGTSPQASTLGPVVSSPTSSGTIHAKMTEALARKATTTTTSQQASPAMEASLQLDAPSHFEADADHQQEDLSVLQIKALLAQPQYFTDEQREQLVTRRRCSLINTVVHILGVAVIVFTAFTVAARVGLSSHHLSPNLIWAELTVDVVWILTRLFTSLALPFEDHGHFIHDTWAIVKSYVGDPKRCLTDVVCNVPALIVLLPLGLGDFDYARVNLLLREVTLPRLLAALEQQLPATWHPAMIRLSKYSLYLILMVTHLATVLMLSLRYDSADAVERWVDLSLESQFEVDAWFWFSRIWREALTLIAEKRLPYPHEDSEVATALVLVVGGLVTLAIILATVEEIIVEEINEGSVLNKKLEEVLIALDEREIPSDLQREITDYYTHMYEINRTFDFEAADDLLADLPESLYHDIEMECNANIIRKIPIFAQVANNRSFVRLLAGKLQQVVIMPGANIVSKGDDGDCMFFLNSGIASVKDPDEGVVEVAELGAGAFIGERTMLFGGQRDRDITAKTLCVCSVITDDQFERVVEDFPEVLEPIVQAAMARMHHQHHHHSEDGARLGQVEIPVPATVFPPAPPDVGLGSTKDDDDGTSLQFDESLVQQYLGQQQSFESTSSS